MICSASIYSLEPWPWAISFIMSCDLPWPRRISSHPVGYFQTPDHKDTSEDPGSPPLLCVAPYTHASRTAQHKTVTLGELPHNDFFSQGKRGLKETNQPVDRVAIGIGGRKKNWHTKYVVLSPHQMYIKLL